MSGYLKDRKDKASRQIIFQSEKLDMEAVWKKSAFIPVLEDASLANRKERAHGEI